MTTTYSPTICPLSPVSEGVPSGPPSKSSYTPPFAVGSVTIPPSADSKIASSVKPPHVEEGGDNAGSTGTTCESGSPKVKAMVAKAKAVAGQIWVLLHAKQCTFISPPPAAGGVAESSSSSSSQEGGGGAQKQQQPPCCCPVPHCAATKKLYALSRVQAQHQREVNARKAMAQQQQQLVVVRSDEKKENEEVDEAEDDGDENLGASATKKSFSTGGGGDAVACGLLTEAQAGAIHEAKKLLCHVQTCRAQRLEAPRTAPHFCLVCSLVSRARMTSPKAASASTSAAATTTADDSILLSMLDFSRMSGDHHHQSASADRQRRLSSVSSLVGGAQTKRERKQGGGGGGGGGGSSVGRLKQRSESLGSYAEEATRPLLSKTNRPASPGAAAAAAALLRGMGGDGGLQQRKRSRSMADSWSVRGGDVDDGAVLDGFEESGLGGGGESGRGAHGQSSSSSSSSSSTDSGGNQHGQEGKRARSLSFSTVELSGGSHFHHHRRRDYPGPMSAEDEQAAQLLSVLGGRRPRSHSVSSVASLSSVEEAEKGVVEAKEADVVLRATQPPQQDSKRPRAVSWGGEDWRSIDDASELSLAPPVSTPQSSVDASTKAFLNGSGPRLPSMTFSPLTNKTEAAPTVDAAKSCSGTAASAVAVVVGDGVAPSRGGPPLKGILRRTPSPLFSPEMPKLRWGSSNQPPV